MNNPELMAAVAAYQQKSFKSWLVTCTAIGSFTLATHCCIHLVQLKSYILNSYEQKSLTATITELNRSWGQSQQLIKKLAAARKQHTLLSKGTDLSTVLLTISQAIPAHAFLTDLVYTPESISLSGFAPDAQEVEYFRAALTTTPLSDVLLANSDDEAAGIRFEITAQLVS